MEEGAPHPQQQHQSAQTARGRHEKFLADNQRAHVVMDADHAAVWDFTVPFEPFRAVFDGSRVRPNLYSAPFTVGSYVWRVLLTTDESYLSVFLDNTHVTGASEGWQCTCIFRFELLGAEMSYGGHSDLFTFLPKKHSDRGYPKFQHLDRVLRSLEVKEDGDGERIEVFTVRVSVKDVQTQRNKEMRDAVAVKEELGFVGLRNQGATCYLNSFLQTLFHLPSFRAATYRLPTNMKQVATSPESSARGGKANVAYQLAKLFYKLQSHSEPSKTADLTESFGWTKAEAFEQHDVQELSRILLDNLETKMKGTTDELTLKHLFMGKVRKYVTCRDIDFTSSRTDSFYDLQLQVKGCKYLVTSIERELKEEELVGDNKYHCVDEGRGIDSREDADMGIEFVVLPPVLVLHLRRFEYDLNTFQYEKVNDYYEFPEHLDMQPYLTASPCEPQPPIPIVSTCTDKAWDDNLNSSPTQQYRLYSILVHSGYMHGGHYHAFISPANGAQWYRFNDSSVTRVSRESAVNDSYGGKHESRFWLEHTHKDTSAYMLVYVKEDRWGEIVGDLPCKIPKELRSELLADDEAEAKLEKETKEAHLYNQYVLVTVDDVRGFVESNGGQLGLVPDVKKLQRKTLKIPKTSQNNLSEAITAHLSSPTLVWPTTQWLSPRTHTSGYPIPHQPTRTTESRIKSPSILPLFVLPPASDTTPEHYTTLAFVKQYHLTAHSRGHLTLAGQLYLDPGASLMDQLDYILENIFGGKGRDGLEVYLEVEKGLQECGEGGVGEGAVVVVVCWEQCFAEKACEDGVPGVEQVEWAEKILEGHGIDRSNVYWEGGKLVKKCANSDVHEAVRRLNHPTVRPPLPPPVPLPDFYTTLRTTSALSFFPLSDDFSKKTPPAPTPLFVHASLTPSEICQSLAPLIGWPPSKLRLWSMFQDKADRQFTEGTLAQHLPRFPHSAYSEIGYELLDYSLRDLEEGFTEVHLQYMTSKVKVGCRVNFIVQQGTTVGEVLRMYHKRLESKVPQEERPATPEELILVKVLNSRVDSIVAKDKLFETAAQGCSEELTLRVEPQPVPLAVGDTVPPGQVLIRVALMELRGVVPIFHGMPFLMFIPKSSTGEELIAAARNLICLRAELRNTRLHTLVHERLGDRIPPAAKLQDYFSELPPEELPSFGLECKKRAQHHIEKAIKIHN